ncbi:MAG: hypothetical protein G01um101456_319, partial [Parcubacteria group bacterium Gr01-1014_56]
MHFLNIEYLLLRLYEVVHGLPIVSGAYSEATAPASSVLTSIAGVLGSIALIGMFATILLIALLVWVHIRLTTVEHEGSEEKKKKFDPVALAALSA